MVDEALTSSTETLEKTSFSAAVEAISYLVAQATTCCLGTAGPTRLPVAAVATLPTAGTEATRVRPRPPVGASKIW